MKLSIITATHHRPERLKSALSSLLEQTCCDFEWIVVNDGGNLQTRQLIAETKLSPFEIIYVEMEHPTSGFGLCHARNLGIERASGELIAYLDDDNRFQPNFVRCILKWFAAYPALKYAMSRQNRRRDIENLTNCLSSRFLFPPRLTRVRGNF